MSSSANAKLEAQQYKDVSALLDGIGWSFKLAKKDKEKMDKGEVPAQVRGLP